MKKCSLKTETMRIVWVSVPFFMLSGFYFSDRRVLVLNVPPVNTMLLNANYVKQITFRFNILEK